MRQSPSRLAAFTMIVLLVTTVAAGQSRSRGITGRPAPSLGVERWFNLAEGASAPDVEDYHGRVLYLYCFQSWCPGCHRRGFPTLQTLIKAYDDADDVDFVAVQTVFEGFQTNDEQAALRTAQRYGLEIPVGHDGAPDARSKLMQRYRTGGTPWVVIIDRNGVVRFDGFHIDADEAQRLIDELRREPVRARVEVVTLPDERGGQDVVGTAMPKTRFDAWRHVEDERAQPKPGQVTLYRWWTDGCPYCVASLPAFEVLRERYAHEGLATVAVYHPKPPASPVEVQAVIDRASRMGYHGAVAIDEDWSEYRRAYAREGGRRRRATSISLLVDGEGVIRFVHPGPVYFPEDDRRDPRPNQDFELLDQAVRAVLGLDTEPSPAPVSTEGG